MNKKAFTLVELMGVITVLGLITLLIAPTIINQIRNSKGKIDSVTEKLIYSATDLYLDNKESDYPKIEGAKYCITLKSLVEDGKLSKPVLDSNGDEISLDKVITVDIENNVYNYSVPNSCELKLGRTLRGLSTIDSSLEIVKVHSCAFEGICEIGTAFAIRVNNNETYKFYVLNDDGEKVTLIMERNLGSQVSWLNQEHYELAGGQVWDSASDHTSFGPLTALKALKERTASWQNIDEYSYTLEDQSGKYPAYSGELVQNVRARLLKRNETKPLGCVAWTTGCPIWLYEGSGFWLSDSHLTSLGWMVANDGVLGVGNSSGLSGIRPVIELSK